MKKIDARGKACPQPVMMTRKAIDEGENSIEVLVDNKVASGNVKRLVEKMGYAVSIQGDEEVITLHATRNAEEGTVSSASGTEQDKQTSGKIQTTVFISNKIMGGDDADLGEVLIKAFLGTLSEMASPPEYISLMNEGVKLALKGTSTCEHLQELEKKGSEILVCGTCTNHFNITESFLNVDKVISV
jgi:selenium metabolism protein YedF